MKHPTISIIIPVYNQAKWVQRCIRSLLNQNFKRDKYEIIIIDDASTDNSLSMLKKFDNEIILIKHKNNLGLPSALNTGIKSSQAGYIVRVDADDYVNENFLLFLHEFMEQNKEIDAVACDYLLVDKKENVIERKNCNHYPIGCGILFKTENLFEIGLYDEDFKLNEEKDLRIRFEKKYNIYRLRLPLYRYRRHQNNITNDSEGMIEHDKKLERKHKLL